MPKPTFLIIIFFILSVVPFWVAPLEINFLITLILSFETMAFMTSNCTFSDFKALWASPPLVGCRPPSFLVGSDAGSNSLTRLLCVCVCACPLQLWSKNNSMALNFFELLFIAFYNSVDSLLHWTKKRPKKLSSLQSNCGDWKLENGMLRRRRFCCRCLPLLLDL